MKKKLVLFFILSLILSSCSALESLGAENWIKENVDLVEIKFINGTGHSSDLDDPQYFKMLNS